jgi:hypothetical protein
MIEPTVTCCIIHVRFHISSHTTLLISSTLSLSHQGFCKYTSLSIAPTHSGLHAFPLLFSTTGHLRPNCDFGARSSFPSGTVLRSSPSPLVSINWAFSAHYISYNWWLSLSPFMVCNLSNHRSDCISKRSVGASGDRFCFISISRIICLFSVLLVSLCLYSCAHRSSQFASWRARSGIGLFSCDFFVVS